MFEREVKYDAAFVGLEPGGSEEIMIGLRWIAAKADGLTNLTVVAPTRNHFRDDEVLRRLPNGTQTETPRTIKRYSPTPTVLACWPTERDLDLLDGLPQLKAMCVIPWMEDEIITWRRSRQAVDLTGRAPILEQPLVSDDVVAAALRSLTIRVNVSTGIGHPSDRAAAVHAFRILKRGGHTWDLANVKAWAMANGWSARHADSLAEIAEGVKGGKAYRAGPNSWRDDILAQWRQRADE